MVILCWFVLWLAPADVFGALGPIDCFDAADLDTVYSDADVVAVGRLTKIVPVDGEPGVYDFYFAAKEFLKGEPVESFAIRTYRGHERPGSIGFDYLLFLKERQTVVGECEPAMLQMHPWILRWYSDFRERNEAR